MEVQCFNCQRTIERKPSQAKRSNRHYCSRSCAVAVNNSLKPKRKRKPRARTIVRCVVCEDEIPNVTRAKKYCNDCYKKRNVVRTTEYRRKLKRRAVEYLGGKCSKCGYHKSIHALDFHHRDPHEKEFTISAYSNLSWERVVKELDRCVLVCANCHRELHDPDVWSGK
jgi:hypothetical protein